MTKITQKYDFTGINPLLENDRYALYALGYVTETTRKGVRVDKKTLEQVDVIIKIKPQIQVIKVFQNQR